MIKSFYSMPISTKLAISFFIIILAFTIMGALTISKLTHYYIDKTTQRSIELTFENNKELLSQMVLKDDKWAIYQYVKSIANSELISDAVVIKGHSVVAHSSPKLYPIDAILDEQYLQGAKIFDIVLGDTTIANLAIFENKKDINQQIQNIVQTIIVISLIMAITSWLFSTFITKRILNRLNIASKNVQFISKGEWEKIEYRSFREKDELSLLLDSMYKMSKDIKISIENIESLKKFYHEILSHLDILIVIFDKNHQAIYDNEHPIIERFDREFFDQFLQKNKNITKGETFEVKNKDKVFMISLIVFDENYLVSISDITQVKELEKKYSTSKSLAMLGEMSGFLSHELKNIISPLKLLVDAKNLDSQDITVMKRSVKNMDLFLNNFLNFTKPPKASDEITFFEPSIEEVLALLKTKLKNKDIDLRLKIENLSAAIHPKAFEMVALNLLLNAIDAVDYGGVIEILSHVDKEFAYLQVKDNGKGISSEVQEKIFDPFFTTKDSGTGLGLCLVYRIIEDLGADIFLATKTGSTKFTIQLQRVQR